MGMNGLYMLKPIRLIGLSLLSLALVAFSQQQPPPSGVGEVWRVVSAPLFGVTYGGGQFVAVGGGGTLLTSLDGLTWQRVGSGTNRGLDGVTYGGGRFVAVGRYGVILTSP
jgi:hypothetical protein